MEYILVFLFSSALSYLLTIPTIFLAKKFNLVTDRRKRNHPAHTHTGRIPRGGGVPVYFALLISAFLFLPINKILSGILISSFLLVVLGVLDDYIDISPYFRFFLNIFLSILVIGFGLGIPYISNPFGGVIQLDQWRFTFEFFGKHSFLILANVMAVLWLTSIMNMVNWSKGVDGQLPGFVAIAAF